MKTLLRVRINSPEKIIWEGEAESVSSVNEDGPFDILPFHANFITFVEAKPIRINTGSEWKEFSFPHTVIYTHSNSVMIYTNI